MNMRKIPVALLIPALLFIGCEAEDDSDADAAMAGPLASALGASFLVSGGTYYFSGEVDTDRTPSCGSVKAVSTTTTTDSSSSSGSGSSTNTATRHNIESFYFLKLKQFALTVATLMMRYEYNENKESFTLVPVAGGQTCLTTDGISCNGTDSSIHVTCETVDNVKCGGTHAFIFTGLDPAIFTFTANSGTFNWADGFGLDDKKENVAFARLQLNMSASDGTVLRGNINCLSQEQ